MISERIKGYILASELSGDERDEFEEWLIECEDDEFEEYLTLLRQRQWSDLVEAEELDDFVY